MRCLVWLINSGKTWQYSTKETSELRAVVIASFLPVKEITSSPQLSRQPHHHLIIIIIIIINIIIIIIITIIIK